MASTAYHSQSIIHVKTQIVWRSLLSALLCRNIKSILNNKNWSWRITISKKIYTEAADTTRVVSTRHTIRYIDIYFYMFYVLDISKHH